MNKFCEDCPHLARGKGLLKLFDKFAKPTFYRCPEEHPFVKGCVTKTLNIDWDGFISFLKENNYASGE